MELKAKKVSEWLKEGNRVRITLFLPGRLKYLDMTFLKERMERLLRFLTEEYRIVDPIAKSPKGLATLVERVKTQ